MMCFCVFLAFFCDFQHLLGPCFREFSRFSDTSFRVSFFVDFSLELYQFFYDCFTWLCNDLTFLYSSTWHLCKHDFWRTLQRFCLIFTYSVCVEIWEKLQNTFLKTSRKCAVFLLDFGYENQWTNVRKNTKNLKKLSIKIGCRNMNFFCYLFFSIFCDLVISLGFHAASFFAKKEETQLKPSVFLVICVFLKNLGA